MKAFNKAFFDYFVKLWYNNYRKRKEMKINMKLLDYIKSHNDWEERLTHDPFNLKILRKSTQLLYQLMNYAQCFMEMHLIKQILS